MTSAHQHNIAALRKRQDKKTTESISEQKRDSLRLTQLLISQPNEMLPLTPTSCFIYTTTLKSLIYERMFFTIYTSADSECCVRLCL